MSENLNNEEIKAYINGLEIQIANYISKNSDLLLNVERLRKAGDVMLLALWLGVDEYSKEQKEKAEQVWDAAKEGKPQS